MSIAKELQDQVRVGIRQMGELAIGADVSNHPFVLCHWRDRERLSAPGWDGLELHEGPSTARDLSLFSEGGEYRIAKGQLNLKRGWVMVLTSGEDLRQALDQFYPAGVGLFLARRKGTLEVENLRDKLDRQSGMYRAARMLSDAGAQQLVRDVCGPAHQCAKRVLWQIDARTPLETSEASQFNGIVGGVPESAAIPLLCREACNLFVAACRKAAQAELAAKTTTA